MSNRQRGSGPASSESASNDSAIPVDSGVAELVADPGRPGAWTLLLDGTPQSHVDLGDPRHLEFEYMRWLGHLVDLAAPAGQPLRVLHLGGGGLTLARYVAATRPGSSQLAVEWDAALVDLVRRRRCPWTSAAAGRDGCGSGSGMPAPCWSRSRPDRLMWWSRTCSPRPAPRPT